MESRTIPIEFPLDLKATLRPLHGRFATDGWWLTARTPEGPGSMRVRRTRADLVGDAWGGGATWLLTRLGAVAGLEDHPEEFSTDDSIVAELHRSHPGHRFGRTELVFDSLLAAVCGQKVTGSEAAAAMRGLRRRFGDPAPGPETPMRLPPDPVRMAEAPYYEYHDLHIEKRRADLIRNVSRVGATIDALATESPNRAEAALTRFSGIARWTSAKTLEISHGDPDQVAVGDFHYKHIVVHHLTGRDRGTDEEMLELLAPFRPHRGRVIRLLHQLGHEPKFAPRVSPRNITKM